MSYRAATVTNAPARHDRQVIRVLGLLKMLAEGGHPSVHQLAARFKTRRETIYRDIHTLEAIGYPSSAMSPAGSAVRAWLQASVQRSRLRRWRARRSPPLRGQ